MCVTCAACGVAERCGGVAVWGAEVLSVLQLRLESYESVVESCILSLLGGGGSSSSSSSSDGGEGVGKLPSRAAFIDDAVGMLWGRREEYGRWAVVSCVCLYVCLCFVSYLFVWGYLCICVCRVAY